jgi:hypothetical protein
LADICDPSLLVPVTVVCRFVPCSSITSVTFFAGVPVEYFVFAGFSVHVPANGSAANSGIANISKANKHRSFRVAVTPEGENYTPGNKC